MSSHENKNGGGIWKSLMTTQMRSYHLLSFYFSTEKLLCGQCNTVDRGAALIAGDPLPVSCSATGLYATCNKKMGIQIHSASQGDCRKSGAIRAEELFVDILFITCSIKPRAG